MKTLNETFNRAGWSYKLIRSNAVACVYEMTREGVTNPRYEVWKLRRHKKDNPAFNVEAGDIMPPGDGDWGTYGWTYMSLINALIHFGRLTNKMTKS